MKVAVSGAAGRMGRMIAEHVAAADDLDLVALYAPGHGSETIAGTEVSDHPEACRGADVVVESTVPSVVVDNVRTWSEMGASVVVGTSGVDAAEIEAAWSGDGGCLIVPNFSIGAVLMMHFASLAAPFFSASEIIELHHDQKVDAPSGTATATARGMAAASSSQSRRVESEETVDGVRGGTVDGVQIHSIRLPGMLAHQEVLFGNLGEILTIRHDSTDRASFMPGVLAAIRAVPTLDGIHIGLDSILIKP